MTGPPGTVPAGPAGVTELTELLVPGPAQALAGLLGVPGPDTGGPAGLPLLWHWAYLLDRPAQSDLGPDGHRAAGGVPLPPGPGRRRMFAGGRAWRLAPLRTGRPATRRTWVSGSVQKQGRSGRLEFVTVRTEISQDGAVAVAEEQDIVYRDALRPGRSAPAPGTPAQPGGPAADEAGAAHFGLDPGPVLLFRFSALTYNGHRIHYDRDYARAAEGYPGLVVHGPLQALAMAELARQAARPPPRCGFSYRLVAPLFEGQGLRASGWRPRGAAAGELRCVVRDAAGRLTGAGELTVTAGFTGPESPPPGR